MVAGYLAVGILAGLVAANLAWQEFSGSGSREIDAFMVFLAVVLLWPVAGAGGTVYGLVRAGAWLLPAYRATKRAEREARTRDTEQTRRFEVDKLHTKLGLPPIDWEGREAP